MNTTLFGYTEAQMTEWAMTWGVGGLIAFMLFIIGEIAWRSKAGKMGTIILFFVLAFGMFGFLAKTIIQKIWGL